MAFLIGSFMRFIPCRSPFERVDSEENKIADEPAISILAASSEESLNKSCRIGDASTLIPTVQGNAITMTKRVAVAI